MNPINKINDFFCSLSLFEQLLVSIGLGSGFGMVLAGVSALKTMM